MFVIPENSSSNFFGCYLNCIVNLVNIFQEALLNFIKILLYECIKIPDMSYSFLNLNLIN